MKKLLVGLLAIGSLSAQASMLEINGPLDEKLFESEMSQDKTYFEILGNLYENGTLPDITKMTNIAFSGRCFSFNSPNDPTNGGVVFRQKKPDVGPIGSNGPQLYEGFGYENKLQAPNYYDHFSFEQLVKPNTTFYDVTNETTYLETNRVQKLRLRFSGKYLVSSLIGTLETEEVIQRCYYFIPEQNLE